MLYDVPFSHFMTLLKTQIGRHFSRLIYPVRPGKKRDSPIINDCLLSAFIKPEPETINNFLP